MKYLPMILLCVLVLLFLPMLYSCRQQVEEYDESNTTQDDTLNIKKIKIQTH